MLVLTFAPCAGVVFLPSTGANTPLAYTWWSSPAATCTGGVLICLPATDAHTPLALMQLALCGGRL